MLRACRLALLGMAVLIPAVHAADDVGSGRRVQSVTTVQSVPVGDAPGHEMGVVAFAGLTFFANGEIATHTNPATFDLTNGSGPHQGWVVHTFDDGSTAVERYAGRALLTADGQRTVVEGTFTCAGGSGRFAGLKGEGTYRGERFGRLAAGANVYVDFEGSCTVPE
jgi:hypothetical protein